MRRIVGLDVLFSLFETKRGVKKRVKKIHLDVDIEFGAGTGANEEVRQIVFNTLKKAAKGKDMFYVIAEFNDNGDRYFKTIVPRSEIPVSLRRV